MLKLVPQDEQSIQRYSDVQVHISDAVLGEEDNLYANHATHVFNRMRLKSASEWGTMEHGSRYKPQMKDLQVYTEQQIDEGVQKFLGKQKGTSSFAIFEWDSKTPTHGISNCNTEEASLQYRSAYTTSTIILCYVFMSLSNSLSRISWTA